MMHLTKQEQWVLVVIIGLLLTGWAVKAWREAHPSPPVLPTTPASAPGTS